MALVRKALFWLRRLAEGILAALLGVMFAAFIIQIVFRYFFNLPTGWTSELIAITWLWLVLWGAAFVVSDEEEIRIDLVTSVTRRGVRRAMFILVAITIVVLYVLSFPAAFSYVTFMRVEKSSYLKIPMDWVFSIFLLFVLAVVVRYLWLLRDMLRGKAPDAVDPTKMASGI
jgi:TRAP-type C4-dicarboxylate transport system permease small subunit